MISLAFLSPTNPISLIAYLLSTYALVITIIGLKRVCRRLKQLVKGDEIRAIVRFRQLMNRHKLTAMYLDSKDFRAEVSLYFGLAFNLCLRPLKQPAEYTIDLPGSSP